LDGGKGQLGVGVRVLAELGLTGEIELAALAKQFEEVFRPGVSEPIRIPRGSEALYLLQRVRDEAHRFAITFHRERRAKSMTASALEGIPGLGPTRAKRLLAHAGSLKALRGMSRDELRSLSWLPDPVAEAVFARLLVGGAPGVRSLARPRRATAVGPD
jgi:excinuclease ABC subunit C